MTKPTVTINVVSDVVCPWCYIGKRRLEKAIDAVKDEVDVQVTYLPFELNPQMPALGADQKKYLTAKFGSEARYHQITQHVTQVAREEGLHFDFEKQHVAPNTRNAHRLLWWAGTLGHQAALKEALMKAYFEQGINLSTVEALADIAAGVGLHRTEALGVLNSNQGEAEVAREQERNRQRGISGVPFFIVNQQYGISGAQPVDTFVQALRQIGKEMESTGQACEVTGAC
jgi:predicted DsbA family dithiol-disulfide isomerase